MADCWSLTADRCSDSFHSNPHTERIAGVADSFIQTLTLNESLATFAVSFLRQSAPHLSSCEYRPLFEKTVPPSGFFNTSLPQDLEETVIVICPNFQICFRPRGPPACDFQQRRETLFLSRHHQPPRLLDTHLVIFFRWDVPANVSDAPRVRRCVPQDWFEIDVAVGDVKHEIPSARSRLR